LWSAEDLYSHKVLRKDPEMSEQCCGSCGNINCSCAFGLDVISRPGDDCVYLQVTIDGCKKEVKLPFLPTNGTIDPVALKAAVEACLDELGIGADTDTFGSLVPNVTEDGSVIGLTWTPADGSDDVVIDFPFGSTKGCSTLLGDGSEVPAATNPSGDTAICPCPVLQDGSELPKDSVGAPVLPGFEYVNSEGDTVVIEQGDNGNYDLSALLSPPDQFTVRFEATEDGIDANGQPYSAGNSLLELPSGEVICIPEKNPTSLIANPDDFGSHEGGAIITGLDPTTNDVNPEMTGSTLVSIDGNPMSSPGDSFTDASSGIVFTVAADGTLTADKTNATAGSYTLPYDATDPEGDTASSTFTIECTEIELEEICFAIVNTSEEQLCPVNFPAYTTNAAGDPVSAIVAQAAMDAYVAASVGTGWTFDPADCKYKTEAPVGTTPPDDLVVCEATKEGAEFVAGSNTSPATGSVPSGATITVDTLSANGQVNSVGTFDPAGDLALFVPQAGASCQVSGSLPWLQAQGGNGVINEFSMSLDQNSFAAIYLGNLNHEENKEIKAYKSGVLQPGVSWTIDWTANSYNTETNPIGVAAPGSGPQGGALITGGQPNDTGGNNEGTYAVWLIPSDPTIDEVRLCYSVGPAGNGFAANSVIMISGAVLQCE